MKINEKISPKVYFLNSITFSLLFIISFGIIYFIAVNKPSLQDIPMFLIISFTLMISSFISVAIHGTTRQNIYNIEPGKISIATTRMLPMYGQTIYVNDIVQCRKIKAIPFSFYFKKDYWKYMHGLCSFYQHELFLISLKKDYKVVHRGKSYQGPPPPDKPLGKILLKRNPFFKKHFSIPAHVIDSYIMEGYKFPMKNVR